MKIEQLIHSDAKVVPESLVHLFSSPAYVAETCWKDSRDARFTQRGIRVGE